MAPPLASRSAADAVTPAAKENISGTIVACASVMLSLSTLIVGLRFYVRGKMLRAIASEDWCILAAWVFTAATSIGAIKEAQVALGRHQEDVPAENMLTFFKITFFKTLFYNLSLCLIKLSILLLYLRVLKTYDYVRKAMWATLGFVAVYTVVLLALYFTICVPLNRMWDRSVEGYCHPDAVWWTMTYIHIVTDFVIFLLPIPVMVTMTIPAIQKAGLLFVFCVGFFVCIISILRAVWLNQLYLKPDVTWRMTDISNWSTVEINIGVVCACMTTLRPLFHKVFRPLINQISPPRQEEPAGPVNRPPTIGSSPLKAIRARVLYSMGRPTFMEVNSLTTVNELDTVGSSTLGKTGNSDGKDASGKSGSAVEEVVTPPKKAQAKQ